MPDVADVSAVHPRPATLELLAASARTWVLDHPGDHDLDGWLVAARQAFDQAAAPAGQLALVAEPVAPAAVPRSGFVLGSDHDLAFVEFWTAYPRKIGKGAARKAWAAARRKGVAPEVLVAGARRYAAERAGADPQYTAHASTWLNGERWGDEPDPAHVPAPTGRQSATAGTMSAARALLASGRHRTAPAAAALRSGS